MSGFLKFSAFKRIQKILSDYWIVGYNTDGNFRITFKDFIDGLSLDVATGGGTPIFFSGLNLPSINNLGDPLKKGDWALLEPGKTYVNINGGANIPTPVGRWSISVFNGSYWVLKDLGALPNGVDGQDGASILRNWVQPPTIAEGYNEFEAVIGSDNAMYRVRSGKSGVTSNPVNDSSSSGNWELVPQKTASSITAGNQLPVNSDAVINYTKVSFYNPPIIPTIVGYYHKDTGAFISQSGYFSSPKYKTVPGEKFINPFQGAGNAAQSVFFKQDGTFLSSSMGVTGEITAPSGAYEVAFVSNTADTKILADSQFWALQSSINLIESVAIEKGIFKAGTDLAKTYKVSTISSPNSIVGGFSLFEDTIYPDANWWVTPLIPIRKCSVTISGLFVSSSAKILIYDTNKTPVKRIDITSATLNIDFLDIHAYIRIPNRTGNTLKINLNSDLNIGLTVNPLPRKVSKINENLAFSLGVNDKRFSVEFKPKVDLNTDIDSLNVISGGVINFEIKKALTSQDANIQHIILNQSARLGMVNANPTTWKPLGGQKIRLFEGQNLFWVRHTGSSYNLYWECKGGSLKLYDGATVIREYVFNTYPTIGDLVTKIKTDVDTTAIPPFEIKVNAYSGTPSTKLATFEKIQAFRAVDKSGTNVNTCFPTYFHAIDESWHKLEILFKNGNWNFCIDGLVYHNNAYKNSTRLGGELIFDFANFDFRNLEVSEELDYSFPIIRTVYCHGAKDGMGEMPGGEINTIDRTLEIDKAFKKRGFQSISYTQLMKYLKFGEPIPKRSYVLCYDDSRDELYQDLNVRKKLIENNIKTNNCSIMMFADDEEVYVKSNNVDLTNPIVGQRFILEHTSVLTYLGVSKFDSAYKVFKLSNPKDFIPYKDAIIVGKTYTIGSSTVKFNSLPFNNVTLRQEVPYSDYSELLQEMPVNLKDYGFDVHIHDYRHQEALDTMTYEEALLNARSAINYFMNRYKFQSTGVVYPYGNITIDHARIWFNEGVALGYTSTPSTAQMGLQQNAVPWMLDRTSLDSQTQIRVEEYFTNTVYGLDMLLL